MLHAGIDDVHPNERYSAKPVEFPNANIAVYLGIQMTRRLEANTLIRPQDERKSLEPVLSSTDRTPHCAENGQNSTNDQQNDTDRPQRRNIENSAENNQN